MRASCITLTFLAVFHLKSQIIKNADYSGAAVSESAASKEGMPLNYVSVDGELRRALAGR